jgi:uncharacterized membrane protein
MTNYVRRNAGVIVSWAALIVGVLIIFWVSRGTRFQQFGIGLLLASISLLFAMGLFELIWQLLITPFSRGHQKNDL